MKAFVFSDIHVNYKQLDNIKNYLHANDDVDLLIFAGDAVNMGEPVGFMMKFIEMLDYVGKPFYWVPGNNDFGRSYHKLAAKYPSLEGRIMNFSPSASTPPNLPLKERGGIPLRFTGVGGSPASWAGQYAGEKMIDKKSIADTIFVSHVPPPGITYLQKHDISAPSEAKKKLSDAPRAHICGHTHHYWGCGYLGVIKVINPGSAWDGRYAILDLENLYVTLERF